MTISTRPVLPTDQLKLVRCQVRDEVARSMLKLDVIIGVMVAEIQGQTGLMCLYERSK